MDKILTWPACVRLLFAGGLQYVVIMIALGGALLCGFPRGVLGFDGFMHQSYLWAPLPPYNCNLASKLLAGGAIVLLLVLQFLFVRGVRSTTKNAAVGGRLPLVAAMPLAFILALLCIAEIANLLGWCGLWSAVVAQSGPTITHMGQDFPMPRYGPIFLLLVGLSIAWTGLLLRQRIGLDPVIWAVKWGRLVLVGGALVLIQNGHIPLVSSALWLSSFLSPAGLCLAPGVAIAVLTGLFLRPPGVAKWKGVAGWLMGAGMTLTLFLDATSLIGNETPYSQSATALTWTVMIWMVGSLYYLYRPQVFSALHSGRWHEGLCRQCGYDLRGTLLAGRNECPECGAKIAQADAAAPEGFPSSGSL